MDTDDQRMKDAEADLKATAEDIAADAERIREIEIEKAGLTPDDPRVNELAAEAEQIAARMARQTRIEKALTEEARKETSELSE